MMPHWKAGTLKLLAQSMGKRSPMLPEVPTLEEAGYKGLVLEAWYAAFVPKGTPKEIVDKLNAEMNKALKDPKLIETFTKGAIEPGRRHAGGDRQARAGRLRRSTRG